MQAVSGGLLSALAGLSSCRGLVHVHEGRASQAAWLHHRLRRVPYLITRRVQKGPGRTAWNRRIYRDASAVVALSRAIEAALRDWLPDLPVVVIPSSASGQPADAARAASLRAAWGEFVIGHVGALDDSHKGQLQIVALARRLAGQGVDFVLVGSGRDEHRLHAAAGDLGNLHFAGQVQNVADYLAAFDAFIYPSRHEGLGSILLDALAAGLPVVATAVGGIPEIVRHEVNGYLCEPDDLDALEAAIVRLRDDRELRARISQANRRDAERFSATQMTRRYAALYDELAARLGLACA